MIKVNEIIVKPTIFPDGTSQIWKLPEGVFDGDTTNIVWHFEAEREIIDLMGIRALIPPSKYTTLYIPYLPYARQDKEVSNDTTFNLHIFADLINSMHFDKVTSVDVHNPKLTKKLIFKFENVEVFNFYKKLIETIKPNYVVFPDAGASSRYSLLLQNFNLPQIVFEKYRHQSSGAITEHRIMSGIEPKNYPEGTKLLVIDDLCDGGATFISMAKVLNRAFPNPDLHLYVTHGGFSKGKEVLTNVGYKVYTTNSLIKNVEGFKV